MLRSRQEFCTEHAVTAFCCLQTTSGYRLEVVTVRKLEFETDAFAFADKVHAAAGSFAAWLASMDAPYQEQLPGCCLKWLT